MDDNVHDWHDPQGPEPLPAKLGDAESANEFIRQAVRRVLDDRFRQFARAAGLSEEWVDQMIAASQG